MPPGWLASRWGAVRRRDDSGSLLLVIIGYALVATALVVVAVDASALFLTRRGISAVADGAAVAGAQALDTDAIYAGDSSPDLPLYDAGVQEAVSAYLAGSALEGSFPSLRVLAAGTDGQQVTVTLQQDKRLPFAALFAGVPGPLAGGVVHVQVTARARAPLQ